MTGRFLVKPTLFRNATREDEALLTLLAQKTISACYRRFLGIDKIVELMESGAINQYVAANLEKQYCPIQFVEKEPVGFAVCQANVIDVLIVDYRYHQRGLGKQLLAHCEARMFKDHAELGARCFERDEAANKLFVKHGWKETLTHHDKHLDARVILYQKTRNGPRRKRAAH